MIGDTLDAPPPDSKNLKDIAAELGISRRTAADKMAMREKQGQVTRHKVKCGTGFSYYFTLSSASGRKK
jgi:predicted DNA-binding transcriptional regulator